MSKLRVHDVIALDQSLRTARAFYVASAFVFVPASLLALSRFAFGISILMSYFSPEPIASLGTALWNLVLSLIIFLLAYFSVVQSIEASRRIKQLEEDPTAAVRPMFIFGVGKKL